MHYGQILGGPSGAVAGYSDSPLCGPGPNPALGKGPDGYVLQRERVLGAQRGRCDGRHHMRSRPSWQMWTSSRATSFPDAFSAEPVYLTGQPWSNFQVAIVFPV
jgi:hypothetical protein